MSNSSSSPTVVCRNRLLSQVDRAQIRAIHKTDKFTKLQIQAMFGINPRALTRALENNLKGVHKGDPENDENLLSPEFKTALATGKFEMIKNFVVDSIEQQDREKGKAVTAGMTAARWRSMLKKRRVQSSPERDSLGYSSSSSEEVNDVVGKGKQSAGGPSRNSTLGSHRRLAAESDPLGHSSDDYDDPFGDPWNQKPSSKRATTFPWTTLATRENPAPKASRYNIQSHAEATTSTTTSNLVKPLPMLPTTDNEIPSASPNQSTPELLTRGPSRPPAAPITSAHDQPVRSSDPAPSLKPRFQQGQTGPTAASPPEIKPDPDQPPSNTASITPKPEPRDPTPDIQEVPPPPSANPNSTGVRSFLSSLRPPLIRYAPAFEKLGATSSDDLLILKGLPPASIREFLQEVRKQTDMTFLQSLAFISGLEQYSP